MQNGAQRGQKCRSAAGRQGTRAQDATAATQICAEHVAVAHGLNQETIQVHCIPRLVGYACGTVDSQFFPYTRSTNGKGNCTEPSHLVLRSKNKNEQSNIGRLLLQSTPSSGTGSRNITKNFASRTCSRAHVLPESKTAVGSDINRLREVLQLVGI